MVTYIKHRRKIIITVFFSFLLNISVISQSVERPPIIGICHVSFKVSDIKKAREFYTNMLGYQEAFTFYDSNKTATLSFFKVNDRQFIEITPNLKPEMNDRLNHLAFETTDLEKLRLYFLSKGIKVPDKLYYGRDKNFHITVTDPDGHPVEFVQYMQGSLHSAAKGKYIDERRIGDRLPHIGITVKNVQTADKFYKDILGFAEIWRGGVNDSTINWINMRLPESTDYIEYMIYKEEPTAEQLHSANHICLLVQDLEKILQTLRERTENKKIFRPQLGRNKRWILNLYDPDGTRVELMEPHTFK
jgi:catechol 2,3-dioxygenase-like lactoylglutathione lyase family enzyme